MNPNHPTPPEVTPPEGHEILTPEFLRKFGAVEGMKYRRKEASPFGLWTVSPYVKGHLSQHDQDSYDFSAPLGTMAARLTPAPAGFRNVLPGWLAGLETKPKGLMWAYVEGKYWDECTLCWPFKIGREVPGLAYAVPISQKGGDEPSLLNAASAEATTQSGVNAPVACNAAPTFNPDARPWLAIANAPRDGSRILGYADAWKQVHVVKWSPGRPAPHWTEDCGRVTEFAPTHWMPLPDFRPLPPSTAPTMTAGEGTPRTEALVERLKWRYSGEAIAVLQKCADFARTLERELASVTKEKDEKAMQLEQYAEIVQGLRSRLQSAQTRADVAERERDELLRHHDISTCAQGHRFRTIASHPAKSEAEWECPHCAVAQRDLALRDLALRELAELKGEKL